MTMYDDAILATYGETVVLCAAAAYAAAVRATYEADARDDRDAYEAALLIAINARKVRDDAYKAYAAAQAALEPKP